MDFEVRGVDLVTYYADRRFDRSADRARRADTNRGTYLLSDTTPDIVLSLVPFAINAVTSPYGRATRIGERHVGAEA